MEKHGPPQHYTEVLLALDCYKTPCGSGSEVTLCERNHKVSFVFGLVVTCVCSSHLEKEVLYIYSSCTGSSLDCILFYNILLS